MTNPALLEATLRDTTESADQAGAALRRAKTEIETLRQERAELSDARNLLDARLRSMSETAEETVSALREAQT